MKTRILSRKIIFSIISFTLLLSFNSLCLAITPQDTDNLKKTTARFKHMSRVPAAYGTNRWLTDLANPFYKSFAKEKSESAVVLTDSTGLFIDNSVCAVTDAARSTSGIAELEAYGSILDKRAKDLNAFIKTLTANVPAVLNGADLGALAGTNAAFALRENKINYQMSKAESALMLNAQWEEAEAFRQSGKGIIFHANPAAAYGGKPYANELYALARYYLTANENSAFMYANGDFQYKPWPSYGWFDAIGFDLGQPQGRFYELPDDVEANKIKNGNFAAGLDFWVCGGSNTQCTAEIEAGANTILKVVVENAQSTIPFLGVTQGPFILEPNTTYVLKFKMRTENVQNTAGALGARVTVWDKGSPSFAFNAGIMNGTNAWQTFEKQFKTGNSTAYYISARIVGPNGTVWFDDIVVRKIGTFARSYDNALVLMRPLFGSDFSSGVDANDIRTIPLGQPYRPLLSDGSLGAMTDTIQLHAYEGAILVPQYSSLPSSRTIRTFAMIFADPFDDGQDWSTWIYDHIDMASTGRHLANQNYVYVSWNDLAEERTDYLELLNKARQGFENTFLHYSEPKYEPFSLPSNNTSFKEDRFFRVLQCKAEVYTDITAQAYGDTVAVGETLPVDYDISVCENTGDSLYIGETSRFGQMNFNIVIPPGAGWSAIWEFSSVDSQGRSVWKRLPITFNDTAGMSQSGRIEFIPPASWKVHDIEVHQNILPLYWLRLRCQSGQSNGPILRSEASVIGQYSWVGVSAIHGERYPVIDNKKVIPAWHAELDLNHDDYLSDAELQGNAFPCPTDLTATPISSTQVKLNWQDSSSDETSFRAEVSTDGNTFVYKAGSVANITNCTASKLTPGTTYYFRVYALRGSDKSAYSNVVTITK